MIVHVPVVLKYCVRGSSLRGGFGQEVSADDERLLLICNHSSAPNISWPSDGKIDRRKSNDDTTLMK